MKWIATGWIGFISENVLISHNRDEIIERLGSESSYKALYASLSTITTSSILYGYFRYGRHMGPTIATRGAVSKLSGFILQSLGFVGFSQVIPRLQMPLSIKSNQMINEGTLSAYDFNLKCPMDFREYNQNLNNEIHGVDRVTRHAMLWSFGFACLGPALRSIYISEIVGFGFPMVMAVIGSEHVDYRYRRGIGGSLSEEKDRTTSNIPFIALLSGNQSWALLMNEMKWSNAGIAVLLALALALKK